MKTLQEFLRCCFGMKGGRHVSKYFSTFLRWLRFGRVHFSDWTSVFQVSNTNSEPIASLAKKTVYFFVIRAINMRSFKVIKFFALWHRILFWAWIYFLKIFKKKLSTLAHFELCIFKHSIVGSIYWRQSPFRVCFLFPHSDLICKFTFCISKNSVSFMKIHDWSFFGRIG